MVAQPKTFVRGFLAVGLLLLTTSCAGSSADVPEVRLSALEPLPTPAANRIVPLRVSVGAVVSPQGTVESYQPLLNYLGAKLGRPVELVQRRTYSETNALLARGDTDLAFVCTSAYLAGQTEFGMRLLAAPQVKGVTTYHSLLLVPATSSAKGMADLRGKVFAFTDPMSNTGRVYPTWLIQQYGSTAESYFARTFFTYSHDSAIEAVATGLADGAAVDSLVYDYAIERDPGLASRVRVVHKSPPFGIPPVVVGPEAPAQLQALLTEILLGMDEDPAGRAALRSLGVDAFVQIEDSAYDTARELIREVGALSP